MHRIGHLSPYYLLDACKVVTDSSCFIPDIGNLCLFSFSVVVILTRDVSITLIFSKNQHFTSLMISIFLNFTDFFSYLNYFLPSACVGLIAFFLLYILYVGA